MGIFDRFKKKKEKEFVEEIIAKLGCDCLIIEADNVNDVMKRYQQALFEGRKEGYTPLIIMPSERMLEIIDPEADLEFPTDDRETILAKSKDINAQKLVKSLLDEVISEEEEDFEDEDDIAGEFSVEESSSHFLSLEEVINKKVIMAKIPTDNPWEAAAWIPMGGFNECPMPEEQVAVFQHWYEKYRALPALVTEDVWEFIVENPPRTREESESLAWEQFGFCPDIVWQGVGTVNALAGTLLDSSTWYFWWD
ncbi:DUF4253 domain-containing protein [Neobacillus kokaensis]|uniref:DUF4253 domain-containing protein n=1 Tax=Neobacillus kokaensis TaxID=2759023 RepID=A0ABQ3NB13_9BACI|nr:DUF4253 domain-containing protein [Neobacillus kokaensis]GHI01093.1 hypothetical protein AM1BK_46350 [Neobacillus kokaensis]